MKKFRYLASAAAFALSFALMGCGTVATEETVITETIMLEENLSSREIIETASPLTETMGYPASYAESYGYTFAEMYEFMIPTSTVNVRSLPSTDGTVISSLNTDDIATADGYCNETGWYRVVLSRITSDEEGVPAVVTYGYVSSNYLRTLFGDEPIINNTTSTYKNSNLEDGFRKDIAQEVWNLVNAERTAAGLNALEWDDTVYEFACGRAQAIVTDYSHNGYHDGSHGENILKCSTVNANEIHKIWYNSSGHHDNYMRQSYASGACAIYVYDGTVYAVENFKYPDDRKTYYSVGYDSYNDYKNMKSYTASNGVIVRIQDGGGICVYDEENPGVTTEMKEIAVNEYGLGLAVTNAELNAMRTGSSTSTPSSSPLTETPEQSTPTQTEPDTWTASNGVTVYVMNGNAYTINDGYSDDDHFKAWQEYTQSH